MCVWTKKRGSRMKFFVGVYEVSTVFFRSTKKKRVNDEIHVLSGYLAQIHVLTRN